MCGARGGRGAGVRTPPPWKITKIGFLTIPVRIPWKSQSYQASIQSWAIGRWWPDFSGIWIHSVIKKKLDPSEKTFWIRAWSLTTIGFCSQYEGRQMQLSNFPYMASEYKLLCFFCLIIYLQNPTPEYVIEYYTISSYFHPKHYVLSRVHIAIFLNTYGLIYCICIFCTYNKHNRIYNTMLLVYKWDAEESHLTYVNMYLYQKCWQSWPMHLTLQRCKPCQILPELHCC